MQGRSEVDVLNGANVAALRYGTSGDWEVLQFRDADLIAPREYRLKGLLRGQAGTDGIMPDVWPEGSDFVLVDGALAQIRLQGSMRGVERHYRVGPARKPYDDTSYVHRVETFEGVGLRPYRPGHMSAVRRSDLAIEITWVRRTRIDGDSWAGSDVPLGEDSEAYLLRIRSGGVTLREVATAAPRFVYAAAEQTEDGAVGELVFEVAQVSVRFGPGPFARISFDD